MKLSDLEKHMRAHGCSPKRQGKHAIWERLATGKDAAVPRHPEIAWGTVKAICDQLEIERPKGR